MSNFIRQVLGVVLLLFAIWAARQFYLYCNSFMGKDFTAKPAPIIAASGADASLPGMPVNLEASLAAAQQQGAKTMRRWLDYYGPYISDPRKAAIELDYVVMIGTTDWAEACRVFAEIKGRTPVHSPVHPRIKKLEKAYE